MVYQIITNKSNQNKKGTPESCFHGRIVYMELSKNYNINTEILR